VAARRAVRHRGLTSVLVFDLDVHQGDGTAAIFHDDPSVRSNYTTVSALLSSLLTPLPSLSLQVFTVSIHCQENFPFRKSTSDIDVGLVRTHHHLAAPYHHRNP